ncbi:MAG: TRAP transporter substrate-binding protein, partial [Parabacteroides sp.]|nr:TRAP transporter substrate-binding protein [Parabacteroides sp.]
GANPVPVSWGEVFTSLSQGTIDGLDHSLGIIVDNKFYESAKYLTVTHHTSSPNTVIISQATLDSLPDDIRETFLDGAKQMTEMQRELEYKYEQKCMQTLKDNGVEIGEISDEMREDMKEAVKPVYDFQKKDSGADIVDAFIATGGNN